GSDGSPDTFLTYKDGEMLVRPWQLVGEIADIGDYFPDERWTFPHQLDVICDEVDCATAGADLDDFRTFISPQVELPIGPSSYPPSYAFSEDLTVPEDRLWQWSSAEVGPLSFASGTRLVVEGALET